MTELIRKHVVDNIVDEFKEKVTSETTPQEILEIIKNIVYESINSIDANLLWDVVEEKFKRALHRAGIRP
ncbi:MAG: hypothetical protein WC364_12915 [Eubacteriales bacterium]